MRTICIFIDALHLLRYVALHSRELEFSHEHFSTNSFNLAANVAVLRGPTVF